MPFSCFKHLTRFPRLIHEGAFKAVAKRIFTHQSTQIGLWGPLFHSINVIQSVFTRILSILLEIDLTVQLLECRFKILAGKPAGKRPLGRPRRRWEVSMWKIGLIRLGIGIIGEPL